jgi:hypothetical protein
MTLLANRTKLMLLIGFVCLLAAGTAAAQTNPATCMNDIDCVATPSCGGDICDWTQTPMKCAPAGKGTKGMEGWCTLDTDCKCHDMGATCVAAYCTFTRPCDAPDAGPCTSTGTGGSGGSSGGGGGGGGCSIAATAPAGASGLLLALGMLVVSRRRRR